MTKHAERSPLKIAMMSQIVQCPGSNKLSKLFPDYDDSPNVYAQEGIEAHKVAADYLRGIIPACSNPEMIEGAQLWKNALAGYNELNVESRVTFDANIWGIPDAWSYENTDQLMVADYKFGYRHVEVKYNWQLITYASAILGASVVMKPSTIKFIIVQPRSYHRIGPVREWVVTYNEFCGLRQKVRNSIEMALLKDPPTRVGTECAHCNGRHGCEAYYIATRNVFEVTASTEPFGLPDKALGKELLIMEEALNLIKGRITSLQETIKARIQRGSKIPGWRLEQGYGRLDWTKSIPEVILLGQLMGVNLSRPDVITPKQAVKAGIPEEIICDYAKVEKAKTKLVKEVYNGEFD